jgi:hypothetical protein
MRGLRCCFRTILTAGIVMLCVIIFPGKMMVRVFPYLVGYNLGAAFEILALKIWKTATRS